MLARQVSVITFFWPNIQIGTSLVELNNDFLPKIQIASGLAI
jgi:hypothetical protein